VLARRRGYCTGLAALYLAVAERLGMSVHAVPAPGHLFLRYDDGGTRINIETQEAGREISDASYRARYRINDEAVARGVYLASLTEDRFLSQVLNNLGAVRSATGDARGAQRLFQLGIDLDPLNVTAIFNLGTERMREGDPKAAGEAFTRALALDPGDVRALNNRGVCRLRLGEADGAVADFLAALALDPEFAEARRNLETVGRAEPGGR
jgi:regulator of sirC expression with transglutaminase-like and TPR domain